MPIKVPIANSTVKRRIITLIITKDCQLGCKYCYEKHKPQNGQIMDFSLAKEIISKYMEADDGLSEAEIEFFGGEPMLAFPLIRDVVEWFYTREWKKKHIFMISTNGTILTPEIKNWLYKYRKTVVVAFSLDGNKTSHDLSRNNSYDLVNQNMPFFLKNWPNQPAKMTVGAENIPHVADSVIELEQKGINFTANIVMEDIWGDDIRKKSLLGIYQEQLDRLVDFYAINTHLKPVYPMLNCFPNYIGFPDKGAKMIAGIERYCGAGHEMTAIDIDGVNYPCHRFLPWTTGRGVPPPDQANCHKSWKPDKCVKCKIFPSCPTCAGFNWEVNGDTGIRTIFHCDAHKIEVKAATKLESIFLSRKSDTELNSLSPKERKKLKMKLDVIYDLMENEI